MTYSVWLPAAIALMVGTLGASQSANTLEGTFGWIEVDGKAPPAEFPTGSGVQLTGGTLALTNAAAARSGTGGRFELRFQVRTSADSTSSSGQKGDFRIVADTLKFSPDGRADRPPVVFRYSWRADGALVLTDSGGHVWTYRRQ
jgi:hypothetical protein